MTKKGFTLIELLVVIAILAVLAAVVILTLNPAELLRQARDSTRISDLATINSGLGLYLADVSTPDLGTDHVCRTSAATSSVSEECGFTDSNITSGVASTSRAVDGTGWIPVNFGSISSGAPFGNLPVDPTNSAGVSSHDLVYRFVASSTSYEINAVMESNKYANGGGDDIEQNDGGNNANAYEVGNIGGLVF